MPKKAHNREADTDFSLFVRLQQAAIFLQREVAKLTTEHGLTLSQFVVLEALYRQGDLNICQIRATISATAGNLTVVIRNLEKMGLIMRLKNPDDKRAHMISLTQAGRTLTAAVVPEQMAALRRYLSIYSKKEKQELIAKLTDLRIWQTKEECK